RPPSRLRPSPVMRPSPQRRSPIPTTTRPDLEDVSDGFREDRPTRLSEAGRSFLGPARARFPSPLSNPVFSRSLRSHGGRFAAPGMGRLDCKILQAARNDGLENVG